MLFRQPRPRDGSSSRYVAMLLLSAMTLACGTESTRPQAGRVGSPPTGSQECSIPRSLIFDGGPGKDGIPALTDPTLVDVDAPGTGYLRDSDRVIGLVIGPEPIAVPLNILWWHEVVNIDRDGERLAITHCPLTGSSLVFDRSNAGGATFGVSGLLFMNNLLMYDRRSGESLWPQMLRGARCGPSSGTNLTMVPSIEMTWLGWRTLYPATKVVSSSTGFSRNYQLYPYGSYDNETNPILLFPMPSVDGRRPPKERILGIPAGSQAGIGLPFGRLAERGPRAAVHLHAGGNAVVLWDADSRSAMAYRPNLGQQALTFDVVDRRIVDRETGSVWLVNGRAIEGPLTGQSLPPVADAFVSFWFAWSSFYPEATLWDGR